MKKLETVSRKLEAPLQGASIILLMLIMVLIFAEVVSRYVFAQSHGFMEDFSKWSQVWIACLMMAVVARGRRHITIDILPRRLPERYKPALFLVFDIALLGVAVVLFWSGISAALAQKTAGICSGMEIETPLWIPQLCIPLGTIFLAFFSVQRLAADIVSLSKGGKE